MQEIGTLVVVVLKARNLSDRHSFYKQDVFSQVAIGGSTKATKIDVKGGQHPVWDEELRLPIYQKTKQEDRIMEVSCWRKEPRSAECIGKGTVNIEETLRTGEFDDWVKLEENGTYRGELYLEMTYFATGPAPLQRRKTKMPASERLVRSSQAYAYPALQQNQSPPAARASRPSTSPSRVPPAGPTPAYNAGASGHLSPPTSTHTSPRTSPRSKYDALPPIPQDHLSPQSIPDILRPGNPKGDVHYSEKPHPRDSPYSHTSPSHTPTPPAYGAYTTISASQPHSPPQAPVAIPPYSSPQGAFAVPASLRPGPVPGRESRSTSSSPPGPARNMLPPQSPVHAQYPASPPQSPSPPLPPLPGPQMTQNAAPAAPYHYVPAPVSHQYAPAPAPHHGAQPAATYGHVPPTFQSQAPHSRPQSYAQYYPSESSQAPPQFPVASFPVPQTGPSRPHPGPVNPERYTTPLPLPDEPEGVHTPTPAHPQPHLNPPVPAPAPAQDPRKAALTRSLEQEERDKLLALELEREEEATRREAEERERVDAELAKKLDMELNLVDEGDGSGQAEAAQSAPTPSRERRADSGSTVHIPGAW
ncbi:uncharacterized protein C8Q71DRAFT_533655 [Rhodofomes roseus]|uniref:C2 domain-containing protein n=1 Tax=Rhodofomes roseus TaxID=34475 RepID=A0ABQ8KLK0_9APHY|nr:uncharacterized protein C8Q71DRAFT_533655 [Rhodofomes roseus]KAH9838511.1 hypothetical protein C8Q71DRAFT_533655 [Rhodofomes roseus]